MRKLPLRSDDPVENEQLAWMARNAMVDKDIGRDETPARRPARREEPRKRPTSLIPVDGEVDLHGCTADEAAFRLGEAIDLAVSQKWKCLRVIHGGSPGRYGPVQSAVSRMIAQNHRHQVESSRFEPGNSGATLVFLKQGAR